MICVTNYSCNYLKFRYFYYHYFKLNIIYQLFYYYDFEKYNNKVNVSVLKLIYGSFVEKLSLVNKIIRQYTYCIIELNYST